jgi:hypothetical protein
MSEDHDEKLAEAVKQATHYGEQVRLAEDAMDEKARKVNRRAFMEVLKPFWGTSRAKPVHVAFWNEYLKE